MLRMTVALKRQQAEKLRRIRAATGASYAELMRRSIDGYQPEGCSRNGPLPPPGTKEDTQAEGGNERQEAVLPDQHPEPMASSHEDPMPKGRMRIPPGMGTPTAFVLSHLVHGKPQNEVAELAVSQYGRFGMDIESAHRVVTEVTAFLASLQTPRPLDGQEASAEMDHPAEEL